MLRGYDGALSFDAVIATLFYKTVLDLAFRKFELHRSESCCVETMAVCRAFLFFHFLFMASCHPQWTPCTTQLKVGTKVMTAKVEESTAAQPTLSMCGLPISCGSTITTGLAYSYTYTGADSQNQWLIEATDADFNPFPGATFSLPLSYNGYLLYDYSIRDSMAAFMQQSFYNGSSYYAGNPTAVCSTRTMSPPGTVTFTQAGTVYIRMVWASFFAPVFTNKCVYTVQVGASSQTQPSCKSSSAVRVQAFPLSLPLLCAGLLLSAAFSRRA